MLMKLTPGVYEVFNEIPLQILPASITTTEEEKVVVDIAKDLLKVCWCCLSCLDMRVLYKTMRYKLSIGTFGFVSFRQILYQYS